MILALLPYAVQFIIAHQVKKLGATEVTIGDIDLNLFAGYFVISDLNYVAPGHRPAQLEQLKLDMRMLELIDARIVIEEISLSGMRATVTRRKSGDICISGLVIPGAQEPSAQAVENNADSSPPAFGIASLRLKDIDIRYRESNLRQHLSINTLALNDLYSWQADSAAHVELDADLNDATIELVTDVKLFADTRHVSGNLSIQTLQIQDYEKFYRAHIDHLHGSLSFTADFVVNQKDSTVSAVIDKDININSLKARYHDIHQSLDQLNWKGNAEYKANGEFFVTGDLEILNSLSLDSTQDYRIASFAQLAIGKLQLSPLRTSLQRLLIQDVNLVQPSPGKTEVEKQFLQMDGLEILELELNPNPPGVRITQVALDRPNLVVFLDAEKQLVHLEPLLKTLDGMKPKTESTVAAQATDAAAETSTDSGFNLHIGKIYLRTPGAVDITDNSVSPVFKSRLQLHKIDIKNLSRQQNGTFDIALKLGDYTDIKLNGTGHLFDPVNDLDMKVAIKQLDLPPVTPYSSQAMGYGMKSGVVDSDISLKLIKREIESLVNLKIDSIEVVETDKQTAEQVSSASGMSIDLAVSTLKDSQNVIELKLPISGNIDKPDFDLSLIINKALGKAMKSATFAYLKHTLQPFGSLVTLYKLAKTAADHISLPPILFVDNSLELKADQEDLLKKVGKILQDRPALKIKACGVSSLADKEDIEQGLLEQEKARLKKLQKPVEDVKVADELVTQKARDLADQRAAKVKAYLLETAKLESSRILNCLSAVKPETGSKAAVELQI